MEQAWESYDKKNWNPISSPLLSFLIYNVLRVRNVCTRGGIRPKAWYLVCWRVCVFLPIYCLRPSFSFSLRRGNSYPGSQSGCYTPYPVRYGTCPFFMIRGNIPGTRCWVRVFLWNSVDISDHYTVYLPGYIDIWRRGNIKLRVLRNLHIEHGTWKECWYVVGRSRLCWRWSHTYTNTVTITGDHSYQDLWYT